MNNTDSNDDQTGGRFGSVLQGSDVEVRSKLSKAVTVANEKSGDFRSRLESLSDQTAEVAKPVLHSVQDHIKENDIDVTISGNSVHIEGDSEGLRKINADLQKVFQKNDVHVEYDRVNGISIEVDN